MRSRLWILLLAASAAFAQTKPAKPEYRPPAPALQTAQGTIDTKAPRRMTAGPGEMLPFSGYEIGPEDLLLISVLDAPEFTRQIRVSASGMIRMPLVEKPIRAAGNTAFQLEVEIARALIDAGLLRTPAVTVTLIDLQSKPVSVSGAVRNPNVFQAARPVTLVEALSSAGGLSETAGQELIVSIPERDGEPANVTRVPIKQLLENPESPYNLKLRGGEDIRVLTAGRVYILGAVTRPGTVLVNSDEPLTLLRALAMAGGTTPTASSKVILLRQSRDSQQKQEMALNLKKLMKRETPDLTLDSNDVLFIPDSSMKRLRDSSLTSALTSFAYATAGLLVWR